jgi:hypothetical protein
MVSIVNILSGAVPLMVDVRQSGGSPDREDLEQTAQRKRALAAEERAKAISADTRDQQMNTGLDSDVRITQGVEI